MAGTRVVMHRSPVAAGALNKYQVTLTCDAAGDLPDRYLFLMLVNTPEDPKDDTLHRVVNIADFDTYGTDRAGALSAGDYYYRALTLTLQYDNIDTGNAAQKELKSRVNKLVEEMDLYFAEFVTDNTGEITVFPTHSEAVKDEKKAAYHASLDAISSAEDTRDKKQYACNALKLEYDLIVAQVADNEEALVNLTNVQAALSLNYTNYESIRIAVGSNVALTRTNNSVSTATSTEKATLEGGLVNLDAQGTLFSAENSYLNSTITGMLNSVITVTQTRLTSLVDKRSTLQLKLNKCALEMATLQASVDTARAVSNTALAAARIVCPEFTP